MRPTNKAVKRSVEAAQRRDNTRRKVLWKARTRAQQRLVALHPEEYRRLYADAVAELAPDQPLDPTYSQAARKE